MSDFEIAVVCVCGAVFCFTVGFAVGEYIAERRQERIDADRVGDVHAGIVSYDNVGPRHDHLVSVLRAGAVEQPRIYTGGMFKGHIHKD